MAIAVTSPAVGRLAAALGLERCRSATISLGVDEVVMIRAQQYAEVNQLTRMAAELETNEYVVITRDEYDTLKAIARPFADAAERSSTVSKTAEPQSGIRTERITLEVTHDLDARLSDWIVEVVDESLGLMESVRVVHEPKLAPHANADGEANHAVQAASGGGEQPRGWLTDEEREALGNLVAAIRPNGFSIYRDEIRTVESLLARSSPPEVVLPTVFSTSLLGDRLLVEQQVRQALAAAGVSVKEVP
jgi:hypothetical protein